MKKSIFGFGCALTALMLAQSALAAEVAKPKLPDPLTLEYALSLADEAHPQLMLQEAQLRQAEANEATVDSDNGMRINIEGRLGYVDPPADFSYLDNNDSRIGLTLRKDLYDFGLHDARLKAAQLNVHASRYAFLNARAQRRLLISQRYFDVILADLLFNRYNEEMAVEYVAFDRLRKRKEAGEVSDYQVKKQESIYQQVRYLRYSAENNQRRTRALLAEALNHPGELPADLAKPDMSVLKRKLPDYDDLMTSAYASNFKLKSMQVKLQAAQEQLLAARACGNPSIEAELETYSYARDQIASHDKYRANLNFKIPLYTGGCADAAKARAQAGLYKVQAELEEARSQLRQRVLDTWLELQSLQARRQQMRVLNDYQDLNLDRSRALYEMEVTADLGDAMVKTTDAEYLSTQANYKTAEAWLRLDILTGKLKLPNTDAKNP